ncbi:MAG: hypothetical protein AAGA30_14940, partial [Planctomycetota bacterium]
IMCVFVVFSAIAGNNLLTWLYEIEPQANQHWVILILSVAMLSGIIGFGAEMSLWISERNHLTFCASTLGCLLTVVLGWFAVKHFGLLGAAITLLVGKSLVTILNMSFDFAFRRHSPRTYPQA